MGTTGARVAFICAAPGHLGKDGAVADHLTIVESEWAYCPANARSSEHDWKSTGGVTLGELELLVRGMREREGQKGRRRVGS